MDEVVKKIENELLLLNFKFTQKPIVIGGMAMEFYGMRKSGTDIDLVICDIDYQKLANYYPENRKDIFGDLGVVVEPFEIWRSIALLDYEFLKKEAVQKETIQVVSLDRLLLTRVCAMDVEKYLNDLKIIEKYYYSNFRNQSFLQEAEAHILSYEKNNGIIFGGNYKDVNK